MSPIERSGIRPAREDDAAAMASIYNYYVTETFATFEIHPIPAAGMAGRLKTTLEASLPWILAETEEGIVGYAHASPWRSRRAYRFSVETTIYVERAHLGQGIGTQLYCELIERLRSDGLHVAIGGIALPNDACIALHEKVGFERIAHFREVGFKFGRWIDVGYWERVLHP